MNACRITGADKCELRTSAYRPFRTICQSVPTRLPDGDEPVDPQGGGSNAFRQNLPCPAALLCPRPPPRQFIPHTPLCASPPYDADTLLLICLTIGSTMRVLLIGQSRLPQLSSLVITAEALRRRAPRRRPFLRRPRRDWSRPSQCRHRGATVAPPSWSTQFRDRADHRRLVRAPRPVRLGPAAIGRGNTTARQHRRY